MNLHSPKDFRKNQLNILSQYIQILKEYHAQLMIKRQKADSFHKSKYALDLFETSQKLDANIPLLQQKQNEYDNVFLPAYTKELALCTSNFDKVLKKAKTLVKKQTGEVKEKLDHALKSYSDLSKDKQNEIEIKNIIYKDIINLLNL